MYRVFIKYCVFSNILKYIPDSDLSRFPLSASVCTQWLGKHQHCSRTGRVQKNHNIFGKIQYLMNTLYVTVILSLERATADRNFALAYYMKVSY